MNDTAPKKLKVLYLFNGSREVALQRVRSGESPGDGFWGMLRLPRYGICAEYAEVEQHLPKAVSLFLRRYIPIYFIHLPLFWKFFSYDIIFTSSAFGSQFLHTVLVVLGLWRPLWVMHDFSIVSMIGKRETVRQKVFYWMTKHAAGVVTLGEGEKGKLLELFPSLRGRIERIPFGVDTTFFAPVATKKVQIFSSGYDPDRDWRTLVRACQDIEVPLVISTRRGRVEGLGPLSKFVQVCDLSFKELAQKYATSAIVVIPLDTSSGLNDAMGSTTLFEAMASGSAIIATRTHTIASYIRDGENGILVPEGDALAMRDAIKKLLHDENLRNTLGRNAREYALKELDAEKCAEQLASFLKRLAR